MQLIANSTGGRIPKFWRPPYGDSDARVTAIAREVRIISHSMSGIYSTILRLGVRPANCDLESRVSFFYYPLHDLQSF